MFQENPIDRILYQVKKLIPKRLFDFLAPAYHGALSYLGAIAYRFPSRSLKVIGVTGTKGKSTTVYLISKVFEAAGHKVAAVGSLGFKIREKEWPNTLKMTMPGRMKLQKFLYEAKKAGCEFVVMEVTSEGIKQKRHLGIKFDGAVFTNLHREHLESHGTFEKYSQAKQELFKKTKNIHVINADDSQAMLFGDLPAQKKIFFGIRKGDLRVTDVEAKADISSFQVYGQRFTIHFGGEFNVMNVLAAIATAAIYDIDMPTVKPVLESIRSIPGRMEFIQREPFSVVVDYAHTPDSLQAVYQTLRHELDGPSTALGTRTHKRRLLCVLGAAGGGRDKWKRPEFGKIADQYCDKIILTDEDPYEEDPRKIVDEVATGVTADGRSKMEIVLDRREAIKKAIADSHQGDTVIITGKGSETTLAISGGRKIPWSDKDVTRELLLK
ncbi:MAG: UDP-N-acetylmuramoyl-L-alanyl-D-glutamate--2,6-diaminopimelate ligase [Candidatus Yanofskybacteria bacterium]|nr:UDP-N-acetylmuramoyl-L-alanyl-D-glutamate--2,6-diaminopimelate ligase [Candidatus Yanofskybacteria bacterium]